MEKLKAIIAKKDPKSEGTSQRWIVGKVGSPVSGALYLPKDAKLPCEITIGFLTGEEEHKPNTAKAGKLSD
jgi:hypothetical protein